MSESSPSTCPKCGAPLHGSSVEGLCPRCLLAMNLAEPTRLTGDETLPAQPPQPPVSPEDLAPHFPQLEILECLGRGGMGVVYKARQKSLNRLVALKLLAPERTDDAAFTARFEREAQALAALSHPNIVTVHDYGQAGGFCYLLMEFVDGVNLRQAMKASRFTPEQALAMVPPICEALQYAHEHGIVHRDIKPENLLLDKQGRMKIADFGIAKILARPSDVAPAPLEPAEARSTFAGTPAYMAPEQGTDPAKVDHRADIYSLGVVLYEMLTGELPAGRLEPLARRLEALHIDVRIDEIVLRALETTPELRYQTAADFRTGVESVVATQRAPRASAAPLKSARGFFTTPEFLATFMGSFWIQQGRGELALYEDRMILTAPWERRDIPFTAVRELRLVRYPFRANPAGLQAISVTYEEGGQLKRFYFTPAEGWFGFIGTVNDRVAAGFVAIRDAIKAATGKLPAGSDSPPQVVKGISWMGSVLVLMPLVAIGLVLGVSIIFLNGTADFPFGTYLMKLVPFVSIALSFVIIALVIRGRNDRKRETFNEGVTIAATPKEVGELSQRELFFRLVGIHSKWGRRCLALSWLGFLGFIGAVPGFHRMWGFTGFFGFIGLAVFIELFSRGKDGARHPAMRTRWHKVWVSILLAVVIALPVHLFLLQVFLIPGDSASPELPRGSRMLVWKLAQDFAPGDMIVYRTGDVPFAARVVKAGDKELIVRRNKSGEFAVSREKVIGKVILNTRGSSTDAPGAAPPLPPEAAEPPAPMPEVPPPKVAPKAAYLRQVKQWQNDVPFTGDPRLRYVAWLPVKSAGALQLWAPDAAMQTGRADIPAEAWAFWMKYALNPEHLRKRRPNNATLSLPQLVLFFSHPAIDESSNIRVNFFRPDATEIEVKSWSHSHFEPTTPGSDGWSVISCPLPEGAEPGSLTIRLHLTAGTWEKTETFPTDYKGGYGYGNIMIGGTGEDGDHHAFITVLTDEKMLPVPQWNMLATTADGTVVSPGSANSFYTDGREVNTVRFDHPLTALSGFFMRSRESRTTEFKDVKVPPMPGAGN